MFLFNTKKILSVLVLLFCLFAQLKAKDVLFDFQANPWNLPTASSGGSADNTNLDETIQINQEGVIITNQKVHKSYYNKLSGGSLVIYPKNSITISAPRGSKIVGVEFELEDEDTFDLNNPQDPYDMHASYDNAHYTSKATGVELKYTSKNSTSKVRRIVVHIEPNVINGIEQVITPNTSNDKIYNIQGVEVGSLSTFDSLPKGVYIVAQKKIIKR